MGKLQHIGLATLVLLIGLGLFPGLGGAAMIQLSLKQLNAEADTIVRGTVTRQVSAWDAHHTAIHTDVTVIVEEVLKGMPGTEVTFQIAGGVVGDMGMRTSTDPVFQDGEQVIVFLRTGGVPARVVGMHQGKYSVQNGMVTEDGQTVPVANFIDAIRAASQ